MAVVMLPLDATSGSPSFTAQQTRQAFSAFLGTAPSGRPLGATSGVRPGTPDTTVTLSGGGSMTWNVAAHSGVLDTQTSAAAGPYAYATDGTDTGSITAANGSNPRVDIVYVLVNDDVQDGSGLTSGQVLYLAGTAASSPVAPAVPARGMVLANINVPTSGGGAPTVSWVAPVFGAAAWSTYTPTVTAPTTNPNLGSGATQTGRYSHDEVNKRVDFMVEITFGTTGLNAGSGTYIISLPPIDARATNPAHVGSGLIIQGSSRKVVAAELNSTGDVLMIAADTGGAVNNGTFTWATGGTIRLSGSYEPA